MFVRDFSNIKIEILQKKIYFENRKNKKYKS